MTPPPPPPPPTTLTLVWSGPLRDRVAPNQGLSGDGALDPTFVVTFGAAKTVTKLSLRRGAAEWDTVPGNLSVTLGVAVGLDAPLLNAADTSVAIPVAAGGTLTLFATDVSPSLFGPGSVLTLTATFSDGTTASGSVTIPSPTPPPPPPPQAGMPWADRVAQPGVRMAVEMSSFSDIKTGGGGGGTTVIQDQAGTWITYDATKHAMRINVPKPVGSPGTAWTRSLPYASQFDEGSEIWLQFDVQWDAGMLTPSNGGGGPKFFTLDEGIQSDGYNPGSCTNGGTYPMHGQILGNVNVRYGSYPTLATICGNNAPYEYLPDGDIAFQNKVRDTSGAPVCTYRKVNAGTDGCFRFTPDLWYTVTMHVRVGTWAPCDTCLPGHTDSQIDFWISRAGLTAPAYLIGVQHYALVNESPGQGRLGKVWLLPNDWGRIDHSVDANVWYRRVLLSSQPLKDPSTGVVLTPDGTTPPPTALVIPDNGWIKITPNPSTRYLVDEYRPTLTGGMHVTDTPVARDHPYGRGYSGIKAGGGKVLYWGGGHGGPVGNDAEIYDPDRNIWIQSFKPEVCPNLAAPCSPIFGGSSSPVRTPLNRPYNEQAYQKTAWNPVTGLWHLMTRGSAGPFTYNPVTQEMLPIPLTIRPDGTGAPWSADIGQQGGFFAPDLGEVLHVNTSGGTADGIWRQNDRSGLTAGQPSKWQVVAPWPHLAGYPYSTYVDSLRQHLFTIIGGAPLGTTTGAGSNSCGAPRAFKWLDTRTMTWTSVVFSGELASVDSVEYDSLHDVLIAMKDCENPIKMWVAPAAMNPVWTPIPMISVPAPPSTRVPGQDTTSLLPTFQFDPVHNVFWYLWAKWSENDIGLWAYRYKN